MTRLSFAHGVALVALAGCTRKTPAVICTCNYGGEQTRLEFPATRDPYATKSVDIAGRFRFKAVYVREPWSRASVNVYAYLHTEHGDEAQQIEHLDAFHGCVIILRHVDNLCIRPVCVTECPTNRRR